MNLAKLAVGQTIIVGDHFGIGDRVACPKSGHRGEVTNVQDEGTPNEVYTVKWDDGETADRTPDSLVKEEGLEQSTKLPEGWSAKT